MAYSNLQYHGRREIFKSLERGIILYSVCYRKRRSRKKLSSEEFQHCGNRKVSGYTFRLDISNGNVLEKSNTAVARDLKKTLDDSRKFREIAQNKKITIRMGVEFILIVRVHEL